MNLSTLQHTMEQFIAIQDSTCICLCGENVYSLDQLLLSTDSGQRIRNRRNRIFGHWLM